MPRPSFHWYRWVVLERNEQEMGDVLDESQRNIATLSHFIAETRAVKEKAEAVMRSTQETLDIANRIKDGLHQQ